MCFSCSCLRFRVGPVSAALRYAVISVCLGPFVMSPAEMLSRDGRCAACGLRLCCAAGLRQDPAPGHRRPHARSARSLQHNTELWELLGKKTALSKFSWLFS